MSIMDVIKNESFGRSLVRNGIGKGERKCFAENAEKSLRMEKNFVKIAFNRTQR